MSDYELMKEAEMSLACRILHAMIARRGDKVTSNMKNDRDIVTNEILRIESSLAHYRKFGVCAL